MKQQVWFCFFIVFYFLAGLHWALKAGEGRHVLGRVLRIPLSTIQAIFELFKQEKAQKVNDGLPWP